MMVPKSEPSPPSPEIPVDATKGGKPDEKEQKSLSSAAPETASAGTSSVSPNPNPNPASTPADAEDVASTDNIKIEIDEHFKPRSMKRANVKGLALSVSAPAPAATSDAIHKSRWISLAEPQGLASTNPEEPDRHARRSEPSREVPEATVKQESPPDRHRRSRARPSTLGVSRRAKAEATAVPLRKTAAEESAPVSDPLDTSVPNKEKAPAPAPADATSPNTLREAFIDLDLQHSGERRSIASWKFAADPRRTVPSQQRQHLDDATPSQEKKANSRRLVTSSLPAPPAAYRERKQVASSHLDLASAKQPALLLQHGTKKSLVISEGSKAKQSPPTSGPANVAPRRRLQPAISPSVTGEGLGQAEGLESVMNELQLKKVGQGMDSVRPDQSVLSTDAIPHPEAVSPNSELFRLRTPILREVLKRFFTKQWSQQRGYNGGQGAAATPPSSSSHTPASTTSSRMTRCSSSTSSNPPPKRKFSSGGNEDDEPSDDEDSMRGKKARGNPASSSPPLWACPFSKWKPLTYQACYAYTLKDISRVKQHLRRRHRIPLHCPICTAQFSSEAARDDHLRQRSCSEEQRSPSQSVEGVTQAQQELLERRVDKSKTKEEQWYSIWDILFPGHSPRPASPYVDHGVSTQLRSFQEFLAADGLAIVNNIARERIPASLAPRQDEVLAFSRTLFEHAIPSLLQRFQDTSPRVDGQEANGTSNRPPANAVVTANAHRSTGSTEEEDAAGPSPDEENTQGDVHDDDNSHRRSVSGCSSVVHESTISTNSPPTDWTPENDSLWDEFLAYVPDMMTPQTFGDSATYDGYPSQGYGIPNWEPDPVGYLDPLGTFK